MKQFNLFGEEFEEKQDNRYTAKIIIPTYEPKHRKPHPLELFDDRKSKRLIAEIENANISNYEKAFLIEAAKRHTVFHYQLIADFYAHSSPEIQRLMERSALVIIDFEKAIQYGFARLSQEVANQYYQDHIQDQPSENQENA